MSLIPPCLRSQSMVVIRVKSKETYLSSRIPLKIGKSSKVSSTTSIVGEYGVRHWPDS